MARDELLKSKDEMEQVLSRTANRCDIWQDRVIHSMARAIWLILDWIIRREDGHEKKARPKPDD